jgi:colanic acid biosynthesis glycosyl transferase WcaI
MKNRLLLIGYNFSPEPTGIGKYSGEMISWLVEHGYDCTVITSYPYYPFWKVQEPYYKKRFWYSVENYTTPTSEGKLQTFRCPQYIPNNPTGLKRIILDFSFLISACIPLFRLLFSKKFDFVLTVAPSFQVGLLGIIFKKIHNAKFLYHIQDLQIEAARDLKMIKSKRVIDLLFKTEKYIFNSCDVISSISKEMVRRIQEKAKKEVSIFPNWTDTNLFYPIKDRNEIKKEFGYSPSDKIILYSGSIGEKQGLNAILEVADQLREHENLKYIICGSGPYKQQLQDLTQQLGLKTVNFLPIQPHENFNRFLNLADVHLVIQKAKASDLVMPSKLTTILAVGGLAIVTANPGSGLYSLVKEYDMGVLVNAESTDALREGILTVVNNNFTHINLKARKYAETFLSVDKIMASYETIIHNGDANERVSKFVAGPLSGATIKSQDA